MTEAELKLKHLSNNLNYRASTHTPNPQHDADTEACIPRRFSWAP